jgi:hypothetical protein
MNDGVVIKTARGRDIKEDDGARGGLVIWVLFEEIEW